MWRKTIYYLKYSAYSVRFSPLHFLLYLGKSITFGTVYSWCSTFHMSMMIISGPRDTNEESTFSRQFKKSFLGVFYKGLRRSRQNRKHRAGVAILLNLYRSSTISRVCHFTKSRESVTIQNLTNLYSHCFVHILQQIAQSMFWKYFCFKNIIIVKML